MLQTTGTISLSDVGEEFQSNKPYRIGDYHGLYGLPAFGEIKLSDFYGKSYYTLTLYIPEKSYYVYTGKETTISISYILDGIYEIGNPHNCFVVEDVSDAINGIVTLNGTYISFRSTGISGDSAGFTVLLSDITGYLKTIDIGITVIDPPTPSISPDNNCIIDEIIGINEILDIEPSLICQILLE